MEFQIHPLYDCRMVDWLTHKEMAAWEPFIVSVTHLTSRLTQATMDSHSITSLDYGILTHLSAAPSRRQRMSTLASTFGVDPSVVTYRVRRMGDRGLVDREECEDDRRGINAVLTNAGQALLDELAPVHLQKVRDEFVDLLDSEDLEAIARVFGKIRSYQSGSVARI